MSVAIVKARLDGYKNVQCAHMFWSVHLLGGLMALGYTIAAILKRSSHLFFDEKVTVKTDWLEQLNRTYVQ
ncbi:hypothetical protein Tco_1207234, partial [Tanacetum coccineum]